jgi:hypothetical protein
VDNPGAGYTYTDAAVLHGRWAGDHLQCRMSQLIQGDSARSTRGMVEPCATRPPLVWTAVLGGQHHAGNPRGNRPRYPVVIGEVDRRTGLLKHASVRTVDTLQEG